MILKRDDFKRLVILGGSEQTVTVAGFALENDLDLHVFVGLRQRDVVISTGQTVGDALSEKGITVNFVDSLKSGSVNPYELCDKGAVLLSLGSPYIIPKKLIELYDGRVINSHGAPLPEWRGGGGFSWRILAGDKRGMTCFHLVSEGIDDGDIILQTEYQFPPEVRFPKDYQAFAEAHASHSLVVFLKQVLCGETFTLKSQDEAKATYFPRLHTDSHGFIDWSWDGEELERFILAFSHPYSGASTFMQEQQLRIFDARFSKTRQTPHPFMFGIVERIHKGAITVCCKGGSLEIDQKDLAGKEMPKLGDRLVTSRNCLEEALSFRAIYTPSGLK